MDVRMPDGTIIKNVPEGTTKEQLDAMLKRPEAPSDAPAGQEMRPTDVPAGMVGRVVGRTGAEPLPATCSRRSQQGQQLKPPPQGSASRQRDGACRVNPVR